MNTTRRALALLLLALLAFTIDAATAAPALATDTVASDAPVPDDWTPPDMSDPLCGDDAVHVTDEDTGDEWCEPYAPNDDDAPVIDNPTDEQIVDACGIDRCALADPQPAPSDDTDAWGCIGDGCDDAPVTDAQPVSVGIDPWRRYPGDEWSA